MKQYDLMPSSVNYSRFDNRRQEFNINGQESIKGKYGFCT
jgi:hypothetical protein